MGNLFRLVAIAIVVWLLVSMLKRAFAKTADRPPRRMPRVAEDTVRCAHCGLHLPARRAIRQQDAHYCSVEHQQAANERRE